MKEIFLYSECSTSSAPLIKDCHERQSLKES